jgi:hypothetical protein
MGVVLNDVVVTMLMHLEEEVSKTKASNKKTDKRGKWLPIRSPFEDEVGQSFSRLGSTRLGSPKLLHVAAARGKQRRQAGWPRARAQVAGGPVSPRWDSPRCYRALPECRRRVQGG